MDYHDPFQSGFGQQVPPQDALPEGTEGNGSQAYQQPPQKPKHTGSARVVALCLSCALLGGVGGVGAAKLLDGGGGTSIQIGERTPVELKTVSSDSRKPMTTAEVYANYIDSCVGITVDIVTKNRLGVPVSGAAAGSGFVVTEDGYIMTNYHVIEGASSIKVTFSDGKSYDAKLVGGEADNDIAIIKVDATGLKPVVLGDSSQMYVGETVLTIGNPLGELTFSLSDGVVSALDRSISVSETKKMKMIQTNCTINSGNSGGPLFNLYGEVIGIVSAKYSSSSNAFTQEATIEGLGFAIPISDVKTMITDIIEKGVVSGKPFLGVGLSDVDAVVRQYGIPQGALMEAVAPGLPAAKAGIKEGDIVTAVDGKEVDSRATLIEMMGAHKAGDVVTLTIYRDGQTQDISVTIGEQTAQGNKVLEDYIAKKEESKAKEQEQEQNTNTYNPYFP